MNSQEENFAAITLCTELPYAKTKNKIKKIFKKSHINK